MYQKAIIKVDMLREKLSEIVYLIYFFRIFKYSQLLISIYQYFIFKQHYSLLALKKEQIINKKTDNQQQRTDSQLIVENGINKQLNHKQLVIQINYFSNQAVDLYICLRLKLKIKTYIFLSLNNLNQTSTIFKSILTNKPLLNLSLGHINQKQFLNTVSILYTNNKNISEHRSVSIIQNSKSINKNMWKPQKIDPFDTINLCNQFLIVHLIKKINSFQARGMSRNAIVYRNAIYSIKKYPLPIICKAQLQSLSGIGQYLSQQLQKLIKKHYSAYLDKNLLEKMQQKQKIQTNVQQANQTIQMNNNYRKKQQLKREFKQSNSQQQENSRSIKSVSLSYKPRINTVNAYFLIVLNRFKNTLKQVLIQQIQIRYPNCKVKGFSNIQKALQQHGYIRIQRKKVQNSKKQQIFYQITQKGQIYADTLNQKNKNVEAKNKIINEVNSFKSQIYNSKKAIKSSTQTFVDLQQDQQKLQNLTNKVLLKDLNIDIDKINPENLYLVIDNRQKKQKAESNFFYQKLSKKFNIPCKNASLSIGDFLWIYQDKVLNFIIQRKIADDLAISILDGRYKDQKYRLKNCGISNIYYFYEGYPSDNCCRSEKQLYNALLKTRAKEGFKVYQTKDVTQTMNLLNSLHQQIYQKILKNQMKYLCTLDQFIQLNSVQKNLTVQKVFALGLMTIPGVGKSTIYILTEYFKTYRTMHDYLMRFQTKDQRIQFMKNLFKGTGMITSLPKTIVELLFCYDYRQEKGLIVEKNQNRGHITRQQTREQIQIQRNQGQQIRQFQFSAIKQESQLYQDQGII